MDTDGDGKLSTYERGALYKGKRLWDGRTWMHEDTEQLKMDSDSDGVCTLGEFVEWFVLHPWPAPHVATPRDVGKVEL